MHPCSYPPYRLTGRRNEVVVKLLP